MLQPWKCAKSNLLCGANIILQYHDLNIAAVDKQMEQISFLVQKFQIPKENYIIELLIDKLEKEKLK